jgi:hypothetical protein
MQLQVLDLLLHRGGLRFVCGRQCSVQGVPDPLLPGTSVVLDRDEVCVVLPGNVSDQRAHAPLLV